MGEKKKERAFLSDGQSPLVWLKTFYLPHPLENKENKKIELHKLIIAALSVGARRMPSFYRVLNNEKKIQFGAPQVCLTIAG